MIRRTGGYLAIKEQNAYVCFFLFVQIQLILHSLEHSSSTIFSMIKIPIISNSMSKVVEGRNKGVEPIL